MVGDQILVRRAWGFVIGFMVYDSRLSVSGSQFKVLGPYLEVCGTSTFN